MMITPQQIEHIETPPEFGSLQFGVELAPVSLQASSKRRRTVRESVSAAVRQVQYLLSGDVQVEIEWLIHERDRYESDSAPDVDNIIKPMLDGICGPNGLLIDDCQVQAVDCRWIDCTGNQKVLFRFRFVPNEWVPKASLVFVHIGGNLYIPLNRSTPPEVQLFIIDQWDRMVAVRNQIEDLTGDYFAARATMPIQRPFHKSRLQKFTLLESQEIRTDLEAISSIKR